MTKKLLILSSLACFSLFGAVSLQAECDCCEKCKGKGTESCEGEQQLAGCPCKNKDKSKTSDGALPVLACKDC